MPELPLLLGELPPPHEVIAIPIHSKTVSVTSGAQGSGRFRCQTSKLAMIIIPNSPSKIGLGPRFILPRVSNPKGDAKPCEGAVVVIVTVAIAAEVPFSERGLGETVHVVRAGAPEQENMTLWLNPPEGATEIV